MNWSDPTKIFEEYADGAAYKASLNERGMYEQNKINERMYAGDQWYGVQCGKDKPLVRYNIIKRIGEYKLAMVAGSSVAVTYSAEGVPNTVGIKEEAARKREEMKAAAVYPSVMDISAPGVGRKTAADINLAMGALGDYHKVTAERVKLEDLKTEALKKAYISGTGVLYTYWDESISTGLYADEGMTSPIKGDIRCEVLDIENVYFGDPSNDDVQSQPYILIVQRRELEDVRREARQNRLDADAIKPDNDTAYMAGTRSEREQTNCGRVTVLTKLYKVLDNGACRVMAVRVAEGATVRRPWDTKLRLYPIAKISWEKRANCIYGDSEVTYLVPNQIAINRSITASVWAVMQIGMPKMIVNGDVIPDAVTNDPGEIIRAYGDPAATSNAIHFVQPPNLTPQFDALISGLISNTQTQAGANDAALGNMRPDNTSAIIAVREAATLPMQVLQNRFYSFLEDNARIWAEYWVNMYGDRALKMEDEDGEWYMPFRAEDYRDLILSVKVDVGQASLWSQIQERQTLDNMLTAGIITPAQYLERLPKGTVRDLNGLIEDIKNAQAVPEDAGSMQTGQGNEIPTGEIPPQLAAQFNAMTPEQQQRVAELMANSALAAEG